MELKTLQSFLRYSDWANGEILRAASKLSDAQLDQPFDMGPGTLRKTLMHIHDGEAVWLARWQGKTETPWPSEQKLNTATMTEGFSKTWRQRDAFLGTLKDSDLAKVVTYRDSKGSLFNATLGDMIMQGFTHSTHHRAQAVNMLRRVGAGLVELDYMMSIRKPV